MFETDSSIHVGVESDAIAQVVPSALPSTAGVGER
jgi:hypothetical protein